jgi:hypothetical protein
MITTTKQIKHLTNKKIEQEELWDFIAGSIGFDRKGKEIQNAIRKFIKLSKVKIP